MQSYIPFSADDFLKFIEEMVSKVRDATAGSPPPVFTMTDAIFPGFELCSQVELREINKSSPSKTCVLKVSLRLRHLVAFCTKGSEVSGRLRDPPFVGILLCLVTGRIGV